MLKSNVFSANLCIIAGIMNTYRTAGIFVRNRSINMLDRAFP